MSISDRCWQFFVRVFFVVFASALRGHGYGPEVLSCMLKAIPGRPPMITMLMRYQHKEYVEVPLHSTDTVLAVKKRAEAAVGPLGDFFIDRKSQRVLLDQSELIGKALGGKSIFYITRAHTIDAKGSPRRISDMSAEIAREISREYEESSAPNPAILGHSAPAAPVDFGGRRVSCDAAWAAVAARAAERYPIPDPLMLRTSCAASPTRRTYDGRPPTASLPVKKEKKDFLDRFRRALSFGKQ